MWAFTITLLLNPRQLKLYYEALLGGGGGGGGGGEDAREEEGGESQVACRNFKMSRVGVLSRVHVAVRN